MRHCRKPRKKTTAVHWCVIKDGHVPADQSIRMGAKTLTGSAFVHTSTVGVCKALQGLSPMAAHYQLQTLTFASCTIVLPGKALNNAPNVLCALTRAGGIQTSMLVGR